MVLEEPAAGNKAGFHILVVDDEEKIRTVLETIFASRGYRVSPVSNGLTALKILQEGGVDLVVLDLKMEGMDGMELLGRIKDISSGLPVVVITGYADVDSTAKALKAGASDFISKPFGAQEIFHSVSRLLELRQVRGQHRKILPFFTFGARASFPSRTENVNGAIHYLTGYLGELDLFEPVQVSHMVIALYEALTNAVVHGNGQDAAKTVTVSADFGTDGVKFVIADEGDGFVPDELAGPLDTTSLNRAGGRGIYLMKQFMDEVRFNPAGNEVTMMKRRKDAGGPEAKGKA